MLKKIEAGYLIIFTLILFVISYSFPPKTYADLAIPTLTRVYFEKDGQPYQGRVDFTVNCYGYTTSRYWETGRFNKIPGTYKPEKVFSFFATCPEYGCEIYESYYQNYRHIDYCDLEGEFEGKRFVIKKYADKPVSKCADPFENLYIKGTDGKTYRAEPKEKYLQCLHAQPHSSDCDKFMVEVPASETSKYRVCELRFGIPSEGTDSTMANISNSVRISFKNVFEYLLYVGFSLVQKINGLVQVSPTNRFSD